MASLVKALCPRDPGSCGDDLDRVTADKGHMTCNKETGAHKQHYLYRKNNYKVVTTKIERYIN